jgi:MYXO-CTERM domain-containing protein
MRGSMRLGASLRALLSASVMLALLAACSGSEDSDNVREVCLFPEADAGQDADLDAAAVDDGGAPKCPTREQAAEKITDWCMRHPIEIVSGPEARDGACCYRARFAACTDVEHGSCSTALGRADRGAPLPLALLALLVAVRRTPRRKNAATDARRVYGHARVDGRARR